MYLEHFGLAEVPFRITPHTEFFFAGARRGATLEALLYAITHDEGIVKVGGEVGSGKTMLCRVLMERLPARVVVIYLANPALSRDDIVFAIAAELGLDLPDSTRPATLQRALQTRLIELYGQGRQVVVLIDEAHAMPRETLEEIRLLSNLESSQHKLLQLVLFGQPELDQVLARPDMRQLKERITQNFRLEPLHLDDITEYLDFRMRTAGYRGPSVFSAPAVKLIARASQGLTRRVNILADKALLAAYADGTHQVAAPQVQAALRDSDYGPLPGRRWPVALAAAAALAMVAIALTLQPSAGEAPPPADAPRPAPAAAPAPQPAPPATATLEQRLEESRRWLDSAAGHRWFLQLATMDGNDLDHARHLYERALHLLPADQVRVYMAEVGGGRRLGLIYGDFATLEAAQQALRELPAELQGRRPHPRQWRSLRPAAG